jgi:hypothetical protein
MGNSIRPAGHKPVHDNGRYRDRRIPAEPYYRVTAYTTKLQEALTWFDQQVRYDCGCCITEHIGHPRVRHDGRTPGAAPKTYAVWKEGIELLATPARKANNERIHGCIIRCHNPGQGPGIFFGSAACMGADCKVGADQKEHSGQVKALPCRKPTLPVKEECRP